jgi:hypothetical protein
MLVNYNREVKDSFERDKSPMERHEVLIRLLLNPLSLILSPKGRGN